MAAVGECRRVDLAVALRQAIQCRVRGRHRIVDQQRECDDQCSQRYPLHVDAGHLHDRKHDGQGQRDGQRDDEARADSEADEADHHDDGDRLQQRGHEFADRVADHDGLVGDECRLDSDRQIGRDLRHRPLDSATKRENVAAIAHRDGKADCRLTIDPKHGLRRIYVAAPHLRDVTQAEGATAGDKIDSSEVPLGLEAAGHSNGNGLLAGLDHTRGTNDVLRS